MRPVLFEFGGQPLYGYWFFYGLGMLLGVLVCLFLGRRRSLPFWRLWIVCLSVILGGFVFARVSFVFFDSAFDGYIDLGKGGQVSFGGLLGALLVLMITAIAMRLPLRDLLDAGAPSILLAQGIQRIGCLCNGCCHGPVYDAFFSMRFPKVVNLQGEIIGTPCFVHHLALGIVDRTDLFSLPVVPMQLVSMTIALSVAFLGIWTFLRGRLQGRLLWLSFAVYGTLRFWAQWFRPN